MTEISDNCFDELATQLELVYHNAGQQGVFDWVMANKPHWLWALCVPCDSHSPMLGNGVGVICAVCFSLFEENEVF